MGFAKIHLLCCLMLMVISLRFGWLQVITVFVTAIVIDCFKTASIIGNHSIDSMHCFVNLVRSVILHAKSN